MAEVIMADMPLIIAPLLPIIMTIKLFSRVVNYCIGIKDYFKKIIRKN